MKMVNQAMQRKLRAHECIDISDCPRDFDGHYLLERFVEGQDYCDAKRELWIWSIGRRRNDGVLLASLGSDLYQNDAFDCLFLR